MAISTPPTMPAARRRPWAFSIWPRRSTATSIPLLLDGGDTIQGSPFTNFTHRLPLRPHPIAQAMNQIGYDYVTLGNHDFNYGIAHLEAYLCDLPGRLPVRQHLRPPAPPPDSPLGGAYAAERPARRADRRLHALCNPLGAARKRWRSCILNRLFPRPGARLRPCGGRRM